MKEIEEDSSSEEMVSHLVRANEALVKDLMKAREPGRGSPVTIRPEDLMIGRIQVHQKTIWMLKEASLA